MLFKQQLKNLNHSILQWHRAWMESKPETAYTGLGRQTISEVTPAHWHMMFLRPLLRWLKTHKGPKIPPLRWTRKMVEKWKRKEQKNVCTMNRGRNGYFRVVSTVEHGFQMCQHPGVENRKAGCSQLGQCWKVQETWQADQLSYHSDPGLQLAHDLRHQWSARAWKLTGPTHSKLLDLHDTGKTGYAKGVLVKIPIDSVTEAKRS